MFSNSYYKTAKENGFTGAMDTLLDLLGNIRLGTVIENMGKKGKPKAVYKLEEMDLVEKKLSEILQIENMHEKAMKPKGLSVYN